jgi:hypothetical protein
MFEVLPPSATFNSLALGGAGSPMFLLVAVSSLLASKVYDVSRRPETESEMVNVESKDQWNV